jgi:hypothetical protein
MRARPPRAAAADERRRRSRRAGWLLLLFVRPAPALVATAELHRAESGLVFAARTARVQGTPPPTEVREFYWTGVRGSDAPVAFNPGVRVALLMLTRLRTVHASIRAAIARSRDALASAVRVTVASPIVRTGATAHASPDEISAALEPALAAAVKAAVVDNAGGMNSTHSRRRLSRRLDLTLGLVLGLGFGSVVCGYFCTLRRLWFLRSLPPELRRNRQLSVSVAPTPREVHV